jgi:nucleoporin POM34
MTADICASLNPLLSKTGIADAARITSTVLLLVRILFCANMILLLRPILPYAPKMDSVDDIPLTPSQRQLLGLPSSTQSTPASPTGYITPPRYRRVSSSQFSGENNNGSQNATPDRRSISANYSSSPLSTSRYTLGFSPTPSQSTVNRRNAPGSPFSPSPTASPLFHKAISNQNQSQIPQLDFEASTFSALGGSSLRRSQSMRERQRPNGDLPEPHSPSPVRGPQIVPGVNYKWLYDKGRKLPKSESSYGF